MFTRYDHLLGQEPPRAPALPQLRRQVAIAHRTYQAARYDDVVAELPGLLISVEGLSRPAAGDERRESLLSYVSAYVVAAKLVTKLGAADLAILAADRAAQVAVEAESEVARGMAGYQVACALLRADQTEDAEHVAVGLADTLQPHTRSDEPELLSLTGALWLIGAIIAARRTDRWEAEERLDRAGALADLLGHDANHAWTAFGPTNVAVHRVTAAASWAERVAPEVIRHNVIAQEIVREMLARGKRTQTTALANLASRAGLLH